MAEPLTIYLPAANGDGTHDRYEITATNAKFTQQVKDRISEGATCTGTGYIATGPDDYLTLTTNADAWTSYQAYVAAKKVTDAYELATAPPPPAPPTHDPLTDRID